MLHNLPPPPHFRDILPLQLVKFGYLPFEIHKHIRSSLKKSVTHQSKLIRPSQEITPMGFAWLVILSHYCVRNIIHAPYATVRILLQWTSKTLQFISKTDVHHAITKEQPFVIVIIDDVEMFLKIWDD